VDPELEQALAQLEGRLTARVDGVESRLRTYMEERIEVRLPAMEERIEVRLSARIDGLESRLKTYMEERIETAETKLLSAFHNWAQTFEVRARGTSAAVREFDERLGLIEERVAKLERSRN
jgi:hypothetical protein